MLGFWGLGGFVSSSFFVFCFIFHFFFFHPLFSFTFLLGFPAFCIKNYFTSFKNSSFVKPACLIISSKVPLSTSLWFGITTAFLPVSVFLVRIIWLPFYLAILKPFFDSILITSCPDSLGSFMSFNLKTCN